MGGAVLPWWPAAAIGPFRSVFAFRPARISGGVLMRRIPGGGCTVAGRRSGTETSIETTSTWPVIRAVRASGPFRDRFRLATAVIRGLEMSSARSAANLSEPGKPASGSTATRPSARSVPPLRVVAVRRSSTIASPRPVARPSMLVSRMPWSGSVKLPPASVASPSTRGALSVPVTPASTETRPARRWPPALRSVLARAASRLTRALSARAPPGPMGRDPVTLISAPRPAETRPSILARPSLRFPLAFASIGCRPALRVSGVTRRVTERA